MKLRTLLLLLVIASPAAAMVHPDNGLKHIEPPTDRSYQPKPPTWHWCWILRWLP